MRSANEIYERMLTVFREKCGLAAHSDSDLAVRLYAAAAELESLYGYCTWAVNQSFPQTASGTYLDLHASLRNLTRKGAEKARGHVTFYVDEAPAAPVSIPRDTVVTDGKGRRFLTGEAGEIAAGSLCCTVPVTAAEGGACGNAAAFTLTKMPAPPASVTRCENTQPLSGGSDGEDDEALRARVLESFHRLPNGANAAFYEERVRQHEGVGQVRVLPRRRGSGTVDVIVAAAEGAKATLLEEIREDLAAVREISVDVEVLPPNSLPVSVKVTVLPAEDADFQTAKAATEAAVRDFFAHAPLGEPVYLAELGSRIFATGKVRNYIITAPTGDVTVEEDALAVLEGLSVTEVD